MHILNYLSNLTSIDSKYWVLIFKTLIFWLILDLIKKVIIRFFKNLNNSKKEYLYTQKLKYEVLVVKIFIFINNSLNSVFCIR